MNKKLVVFVEVCDAQGYVMREYWIDHNDSVQRRTLGEQCRNAFEGGQSIFTCPVTHFGIKPQQEGFSHA